MKITGKAKEAFLKYYKTNENTINLYEEIFLNALIIEFFDSVGIYVSTYRDFFFNDWYFKILGHSEGAKFKSRTEATSKAIEKANEIYNRN